MMRTLARRMTAMGFGTAFSALALATAPGAQAAVIYSSVDLSNVGPVPSNFCSQCFSDGFNTGERFTIGYSHAVAQSLSFGVDSGFFWPVPVTIDIFQDGIADTLGSLVFQGTFTTFTSDIQVSLNADVVSVNLGSVPLSAGTYDLFLFNPDNLALTQYLFAGPGDQIVEHAPPGVGPLTGGSYQFTAAGRADTGIQLDGIIRSHTVPEPMTFALLGAGLAGLGTLRRRRKVASIA